jgi:hypothetical protein
VLWGEGVLPRRRGLKGPGGSLTLPGGGGDASEQRAALSRTSMTAPKAGAIGKSFEEVPPPPSEDRRGGRGCRRSASNSLCPSVTRLGVFHGRGLRCPAVVVAAAAVLAAEASDEAGRWVGLLSCLARGPTRENLARRLIFSP